MTTETEVDPLDELLEDQAEDDAEDWDALDELTIAELDAGSRLLKTSLIRAVAENTADYERGLAIVAYLHARRRDRTTKPDELLKRFTGMRYSELAQHLAGLKPPRTEDGEPDPTAPGPA